MSSIRETVLKAIYRGWYKHTNSHTEREKNREGAVMKERWTAGRDVLRTVWLGGSTRSAGNKNAGRDEKEKNTLWRALLGCRVSKVSDSFTVAENLGEKPFKLIRKLEFNWTGDHFTASLSSSIEKIVHVGLAALAGYSLRWSWLASCFVVSLRRWGWWWWWWHSHLTLILKKNKSFSNKDSSEITLSKRKW